MSSDIQLAEKEVLATPSSRSFATQGTELKARLDGITIDEEKKAEIISSHTTRVIRDKALGLFKIGELWVESTVLNPGMEIGGRQTARSKKRVSAGNLLEPDGG